MPPFLRHFSGPPVLPPVPELSFDILDGLSFEFDTPYTPPPAAFDAPSPPLHSPIPIKLMPSRLIPRLPPSALADVPEDLSDNEEVDDEGRALAETLPHYLGGSPSPPRVGSPFESSREAAFKPTPPLNIRKKMSTSPPAGLPPLRLQHRVTLPDCPRSPTPEHQFLSVEPLNPLLAAIVNGEMKEGGLPGELCGTGADGINLDAISSSTVSDIPHDGTPPQPPFRLPPGIECTCGDCIPPPFAQGSLPPVPDTHTKSTPSPGRSPRTGPSGHAQVSPVRPAFRHPTVHDEDAYDRNHQGQARQDRHPPPVPPKREREYDWDSQSGRSRETLDPPPMPFARTNGFRATPSPQPSLGPGPPGYRPPPPRPPRPAESLVVASLGAFDPALSAPIAHLPALERPAPHYEKSYPASSKGSVHSSVHSRRTSEPESALGPLREAITEGTKAFVTTLSKRREEDRRRSVYSHKRGSESETQVPIPSEYDVPPPTTNAKAVSLLGHHDRRHDRRGSDADEGMLQLAPRPFPGATSKAAALLGIGVAEPPQPKRFAKFSSPKAPNALHAIRRTQPTGWSGAGAGAMVKRMSQYGLMIDDDITLSEDSGDDDLDLAPPAPVGLIPHEEDVTIAPAAGQNFEPLSTRLSVYGPGVAGPGLGAREPSPPPGPSGHPFAAVPRPPAHPRIRPEGTSPSEVSVHSLASSLSSASQPSQSRPPTALQRKHTTKGRPPPISVERISPTRDYPLVEAATSSTALASGATSATPSTPSTARPTPGGDEEGLKSHILAKYRLIEPPIAAHPQADARASTCTATTTTTATSGTSTYSCTESSGSASAGGETYRSRESYAASARESYPASAREGSAAIKREGYVTSTREGYATSTRAASTRESYAASRHSRSIRTTTSIESFGSAMPVSGASSKATNVSGTALARVDTTASTSTPREDKSLTARLHRHVRNASTATASSTSSAALSAVTSATASLRAAASATLSWGAPGWSLGARIAPGLASPDHRLPYDIPPHMRVHMHIGPTPEVAKEAVSEPPAEPPKPPPWHNYNIRYDKDGREIPDLTPRAAPPPPTSARGPTSGPAAAAAASPGVAEESWFEPATPISPASPTTDDTRMHRVGTLVRRPWKRK